MGLGNKIKMKSGAYKLDESMLNKYTIYLYLRKAVPMFVVTLPILEQKRRNDSMTVFDGHGHARTFDNPWLGDNTKKRKVKTHVQCNQQQIVIQHALADGRHYFIDFLAIAKAGKIKNGVFFEVHDGRQYIFEIDKDIQSFWKALGFNPQFVLDTFYNMVFNENWRKAFAEEYSCGHCNSTFIGQLPICPNCNTPLSYGD